MDKKTGYSRPPAANSRYVLIAVDGSEHSKRAFNYYIKWLSRPDDAITIFYAIEPVSLPSISLTNPITMPSEEWSKLLQNNLKRVQELEFDYTAQCESHNLIHQFIYESASHIGESIVQAAERHQVQLLIVGSRGLGAIKRTFLGSVSDYVVHHADTSVCVVRCVEESVSNKQN